MKESERGRRREREKGGGERIDQMMIYIRDIEYNVVEGRLSGEKKKEDEYINEQTY